MTQIKVKVLEEAFYEGSIRPVNAVIDYKGEKIPSWATLAEGQASTVKTNIPIENPVKAAAKTSGKNAGKNVTQQSKSKNASVNVPAKGEEQAGETLQTTVTINNLPDDKKAELVLRAQEAGMTEDIGLFTPEMLEAEITKRNEEKQLARLEELKTIAIEKNIPFELREVPTTELILELEEKINALGEAGAV